MLQRSRRPRISGPMLPLALCLAAGAALPAEAARSEITVATRGSWEPFLREVISRFQAANPDVTVNYQILEGTDKLIAQIAAGSAPDVFEVSSASLGRMAELGMMYDLRPLVARDFSSRDVRDFFPPVWEATVLATGPRAGTRIGLPLYINVPIFWFNRTLFQQAGLLTPDVLDRQGNWTWFTMLEAAKKLTRRDADGAPLQYGLQTKYWGVNLVQRPTWIWANGGQVFDYPRNPTRFMMDQPASLEALQFVQEMVWTHQVIPKVNERSKLQFPTGKLAMDDDGIEVLRGWEQQIGGSFEYDVAPRPMGKVSRGNRTSLDIWAMAASTKNPEAAWRFMKFLVSPEIQRLQARMLWLGPVRASAADAFLDMRPKLNLGIYLETASTASVDPFSYIEKASGFINLVQPALKSAMEQNQKSVVAAIREVAPAVRALYGQ